MARHAIDAVNPAKLDQYQHRQVNFLDLDITIVYSDGSADFAFKVYRKPGTAYAYLPYGSYSNPDVWLEECAVFYSHLRNRLHVSHNQLEPAQQDAGAKATCGRR